MRRTEFIKLTMKNTILLAFLFIPMVSSAQEEKDLGSEIFDDIMATGVLDWGRGSYNGTE